MNIAKSFIAVFLLLLLTLPATAQKIRVQQIENVPYWQTSGQQADASMPNGSYYVTDGSLSGSPAGTLVFKDATGTYHDLESGGTMSLTTIDGLTDVDTSTTPPTPNQVLQWNGTMWVPSTLPAGTDSQTLSIAGNNLSISNGNTVALPAGTPNTFIQFNNADGSTDTSTERLTLVDGAGTLTADISFPDEVTAITLAGTNRDIDADLSLFNNNKPYHFQAWGAGASTLSWAGAATVIVDGVNVSGTSTSPLTIPQGAQGYYYRGGGGPVIVYRTIQMDDDARAITVQGSVNLDTQLALLGQNNEPVLFHAYTAGAKELTFAGTATVIIDGVATTGNTSPVALPLGAQGYAYVGVPELVIAYQTAPLNIGNFMSADLSNPGADRFHNFGNFDLTIEMQDLTFNATQSQQFSAAGSSLSLSGGGVFFGLSANDVFSINGNPGLDGQVLTSRGNSANPEWSNPRDSHTEVPTGNVTIDVNTPNGTYVFSENGAQQFTMNSTVQPGSCFIVGKALGSTGTLTLAPASGNMEIGTLQTTLYDLRPGQYAKIFKRTANSFVVSVFHEPPLTDVQLDAGAGSFQVQPYSGLVLLDAVITNHNLPDLDGYNEGQRITFLRANDGGFIHTITTAGPDNIRYGNKTEGIYTFEQYETSLTLIADPETNTWWAERHYPDEVITVPSRVTAPTPQTVAAQFFSIAGEMWVQDSGGTQTQLSSHRQFEFLKEDYSKLDQLRMSKHHSNGEIVQIEYEFLKTEWVVIGNRKTGAYKMYDADENLIREGVAEELIQQ